MSGSSGDVERDGKLLRLRPPGFFHEFQVLPAVRDQQELLRAVRRVLEPADPAAPVLWRSRARFQHRWPLWSDAAERAVGSAGAIVIRLTNPATALVFHQGGLVASG